MGTLKGGLQPSLMHTACGEAISCVLGFSKTYMLVVVISIDSLDYKRPWYCIIGNLYHALTLGE